MKQIDKKSIEKKEADDLASESVGTFQELCDDELEATVGGVGAVAATARLSSAIVKSKGLGSSGEKDEGPVVSDGSPDALKTPRVGTSVL